MTIVNEIDLLKLEKYVVIDIETTGFSMEKGARVIEVGAAKVENGEIIETFNRFINPELPIPSKITEITGIEDEDVVNARVYGFVFPKLHRFIDGYPLVFHNRSFDWERFLKPMFISVGKPVNHFQVFCSLTTIKLLDSTIKKRSLDYLAEVFNLETPPTHRALDDVFTTVELIKYMKDNYGEGFLFSTEMYENKADVDDSYYDFEIRQVAYWDRIVKGKIVMQRIYVTTSLGEVYYDPMNDGWYKKDFKGSVEFYGLECRVLDFLLMKERNELKSYRGTKSRERVQYSFA